MESNNNNKLKLYSFWKSSTSARVRIALHLKGLDYEYLPVNLKEGEQATPEFKELSPDEKVPVLVDGDMVVSDSLAILMYLEDRYPQPAPLLPLDRQKKAINFQVADIVSSSIQPYHNQNVLKYIEDRLGAQEKLSWAKHHIEKGFAALEKLLEVHVGKYATGDEIYMADLFIAPQIDHATKNFKVDMTKFPRLSKLNEYYNDTPAIKDAMPEKQPDAPSST
ncbi:hypothetical protein COLO4_31204 [Corchorus olitorius]|uniref:glutathione transferase n=1 Tax=Corchorus olitorius TaxID=93759 RepID=A0A1R3H541_9ROSI|nr:hypothetical protein COLO4_31204 [Corchorus olitorius]